MNLDDWRDLIDYWRGQGHALQHLDIPDNISEALGIEIPKEKEMTEQTAQFEPVGAEWKRKRYFDGTTCGLKDCKRASDGYLCDQKPTKGNANGQLWFGPACKKCLTKRGVPEEALHTLAQLAYQRNGASDLALVLDIEVGEVLKRLEAAGIDENGRPLVTSTADANTGEGAPVGAQQEQTPQPQQPELPHTQDPEGSVHSAELVQQAAQQPVPENGTGQALALVQPPAIQIPVEAIAAQKQETEGVLALLENFHIVDQKTMDLAAGWLNGEKMLDAQGREVIDEGTGKPIKIPGILKKWDNLDEYRKALGAPLREALAQIQAYFNPALIALKEAEKILKQKITEGNARAAQAQQQALQAAQQARQAGNTAMVAHAAQQAAVSDVMLPQGVSQTMVTKFEIVDPSQLPPWAWSPDPNKVQMAINQGWREIPGVRIWDEPQIRGSRQ